jgi:hypothetical protein
METMCPRCELSYETPQEPMIVRTCNCCKAQWAVPYIKEEDDDRFMCPLCYERMERENEEFLARHLSNIPEEDLPGW